MMEDDRPRRFRFRLRTLLLVVSIFALLLVVIIQQVQIERMKRSADVYVRNMDNLTKMIRELRDHLERSGSR